jgi:hypothetical protein
MREIEKAIKLALDNSYKPEYDFTTEYPCQADFTDDGSIVLLGEGGKVLGVYDREKVFLSPEFWRCLEKGLGWESEELYIRKNLSFPEGEGITQEGWLYHWHSFIDHLATKKDPEQFFKEILKK